jgi:hypothetical protein
MYLRKKKTIPVIIYSDLKIAFEKLFDVTYTYRQKEVIRVFI